MPECLRAFVGVCLCACACVLAYLQVSHQAIISYIVMYVLPSHGCILRAAAKLFLCDVVDPQYVNQAVTAGECGFKGFASGDSVFQATVMLPLLLSWLIATNPQWATADSL